MAAASEESLVKEEEHIFLTTNKLANVSKNQDKCEDRDEECKFVLLDTSANIVETVDQSMAQDSELIEILEDRFEEKVDLVMINENGSTTNYKMKIVATNAGGKADDPYVAKKISMRQNSTNNNEATEVNNNKPLVISQVRKKKIFCDSGSVGRQATIIIGETQNVCKMASTLPPQTKKKRSEIDDGTINMMYSIEKHVNTGETETMPSKVEIIKHAPSNVPLHQLMKQYINFSVQGTTHTFSFALGRRPELKLAVLAFLHRSQMVGFLKLDFIALSVRTQLEMANVEVEADVHLTIYEMVKELASSNLPILEKQQDQGSSDTLIEPQYVKYRINRRVFDAVFPSGINGGLIIPFAPFYGCPRECGITTNGPYSCYTIMQHLYTKSAGIKKKTSTPFTEYEKCALLDYIHPGVATRLLHLWRILEPRGLSIMRHFYTKCDPCILTDYEK